MESQFFLRRNMSESVKKSIPQIKPNSLKMSHPKNQEKEEENEEEKEDDEPRKEVYTAWRWCSLSFTAFRDVSDRHLRLTTINKIRATPSKFFLVYLSLCLPLMISHFSSFLCNDLWQSNLNIKVSCSDTTSFTARTLRYSLRKTDIRKMTRNAVIILLFTDFKMQENSLYNLGIFKWHPFPNVQKFFFLSKWVCDVQPFFLQGC